MKLLIVIVLVVISLGSAILFDVEEKKENPNKVLQKIIRENGGC